MWKGPSEDVWDSLTEVCIWFLAFCNKVRHPKYHLANLGSTRAQSNLALPGNLVENIWSGTLLQKTPWTNSNYGFEKHSREGKHNMQPGLERIIKVQALSVCLWNGSKLPGTSIYALKKNTFASNLIRALTWRPEPWTWADPSFMYLPQGTHEIGVSPGFRAPTTSGVCHKCTKQPLHTCTCCLPPRVPDIV